MLPHSAASFNVNVSVGLSLADRRALPQAPSRTLRDLRDRVLAGYRASRARESLPEEAIPS